MQTKTPDNSKPREYDAKGQEGRGLLSSRKFSKIVESHPPKAKLGQALASLTKQGLLLCKMADS